MLKTFSSRSARALVAALIASMMMIAPLPLSTESASAASISGTSGTYINGKISIITGLPTSSAKPPALSSFDVRVDGVSNPVITFEVVGLTIIDLYLTSTVYNGSTITISYNAPPADNSLDNSALQRTNGEDYVSFVNLPVANLGPYRLNAPGIPTATASEESATITVTAPTGGLTPRSYLVTATPGGATCTVTSATESCTIAGLKGGTSYTFTTVAKRDGYSDSGASPSSAAITVLAKATNATVPSTTGNTASWDVEPATDSETDAFTEGFWPAAIPGSIIITNEFGFTVDKKNGIKPKIRMKNYAGKITMSISASYKVGAKVKKYKCAYAAFGSTKKARTAKWKWYTPKKACTLPTPLVTALKAGTTKLSATGKWARLWVTTGAKTRADKTKIKPRTLKYTVRAKPAAVK